MTSTSPQAMLTRAFWRIRYWLYDHDVARGIKAGRGSKNNPLQWEDVVPVMKMCERLGITIDENGVHRQ